MAGPGKGEFPVLEATKPNLVSLAAAQFLFAVDDGAGNAAVNAVLGGPSVGVIQNDPAANEATSLMVYGISKVVAGAAIASGALVSSDASGRAITQPGVAPNHQLGIAWEAATAAGQIISVLLTL